MFINRRAISIAIIFVLLVCAVSTAIAQEITGLWQYREIVTLDTDEPAGTSDETDRGVLLSDLKAMPLDLLGKVFGKLSYTAEFTKEQRFALDISVLGMQFHAQGKWSTANGEMTLVYDEITGFERLWWLGGFDYLTHCDPEHTMSETVAYQAENGTLTFNSRGAALIFDQEE